MLLFCLLIFFSSLAYIILVADVWLESHLCVAVRHDATYCVATGDDSNSRRNEPEAAVGQNMSILLALKQASELELLEMEQLYRLPLSDPE